MTKYKTLPLICIESVIGNSHRIKGTENQDFGDRWIDEDTGLWALAIADGHGSSSHPYSKTGAKFAVQASLESIREILCKPDLHVVDYKDFTSQIYVKILEAWEKLVLADYSNCHCDSDIADQTSLELLTKYGTTLCFSFGLYDLIIIASIGDSDVFWRNQSGLTRSFDIFGQIVDDVGEATHSLCSRNSLKLLNVTAIQVPPGGTFLYGTDGIKKSIPDESSLSQLLDYYHKMSFEDFPKVKKDLGEQLNELTVNGSGDDCTLAILHFPTNYQVNQKPGPSQLSNNQEPISLSLSSSARSTNSSPKASSSKKKSRLKPLMLLLIPFLAGCLLGWMMKPQVLPKLRYEIPVRPVNPTFPKASSNQMRERDLNSQTSTENDLVGNP